MNFFDIISSATSNMLRSKVRTTLTIIAIVIGAFTITLTVGLSSGISNYIDKQLGNIGAENLLIVQPKVEFANPSDGPQKYNQDTTSTSAQAALTGPTMTNKDVETIRSIDGIIEANPTIMLSTDFISGPNKDKYVIGAQEVVADMNYDLVTGSAPSNDTSERQILIPAPYVSVLGLGTAEKAVGQKVLIGVSSPLQKQYTVEATIVGIQQESIISQSGGASVNMPLQKQLYSYQTEGLPAEATEKYFMVTAKYDNTDEAKLETIKADLIAKDLEGTTVADQLGIIKQVINAITGVLVFFGAIALLAASFGIINTLYMSVQERTKEIGLMKAMGMSRSKVFLLFSVEAILIGFWGSVIGAGLAIGVGQITNKLASESFLKDLPGFDLTLFPVLSVAAIMGVVMLIALLSGTLPARRAAKQDPIEALRYE